MGRKGNKQGSAGVARTSVKGGSTGDYMKQASAGEATLNADTSPYRVKIENAPSALFSGQQDWVGGHLTRNGIGIAGAKLGFDGGGQIILVAGASDCSEQGDWNYLTGDGGKFCFRVTPNSDAGASGSGQGTIAVSYHANDGDASDSVDVRLE